MNKMWTPQMVMDRRKGLANQLGHTGMYYVGCECIPCRSCYDPTGEEDAKNWNDKILQYIEECQKAGVPQYGECSSLKMDEQSKRFLKDGLCVIHDNNVFRFENVDDIYINTQSNSWYMSAFHHCLKLKDEHSEETFKTLVEMIREIQRDGWISFAKKYTT